MSLATLRNRAIGLFGLRVIIGCLSFQIGMFKLFIDGLASQMQWFERLEAWFPMWMLWGTNVFCAVVEFVAGLMLVFGIKRDWALWAILLVLAIVNFGHGLEAAAWDIQQLVFRTAMIVALLIVPAEWDVLRLDTWRDGKALFRRTPPE